MNTVESFKLVGAISLSAVCFTFFLWIDFDDKWKYKKKIVDDLISWLNDSLKIYENWATMNIKDS